MSKHHVVEKLQNHVPTTLILQFKLYNDYKELKEKKF